MRQFALFLMMTLAFITPAHAVGVVTESVSNILNREGILSNIVVTISWTADASAATVPATALSASTVAAVTGMYLDHVETNPGSPAPTALYDIALMDAGGADVMFNALANRSATLTELAYAPGVSPIVVSAWTFNLSNNSVNSAVGTLALTFARLPSSVGLISPYKCPDALSFHAYKTMNATTGQDIVAADASYRLCITGASTYNADATNSELMQILYDGDIGTGTYLLGLAAPVNSGDNKVGLDPPFCTPAVNQKLTVDSTGSANPVTVTVWGCKVLP